MNSIKDYRLPGVNPEGGCNGVFILTMVCPVCRNIVDEACMAFGEPYYCVIHTHCAPLFPFDGRYPHQLAAAILIKK